MSATRAIDWLLPPLTTARPSVDEAAIARCLGGDVDAFRLLVERHERVVYSVALRMLGVCADAEDVAQQAFADAYAALGTFTSGGRPEAFRTWVLRIAVNRAKDVLKSKKRTEESLGDEVAADRAAFAHDPASPDQGVDTLRRRALLTGALQQLAPDDRTIIVLKDIEGLSYGDIRDVLKLPITTLKIRAVRARAKLRRLLGDAMGDWL